MKMIARTVKFFLCTFLVGMLIFGAAFLHMYQEEEMAASDFLLEENLKDFTMDGNTITSTTYDPFINVYFPRTTYIKTISFYIDNLSEENVHAEIIAISGEWVNYKSEKLYLKNGKNTVCFSETIKNPNVDHIRLDLAETPGISMELGQLLVNEHSFLFMDICRMALAVSFFASVFYCLVLYGESEGYKSSTEKIRNQCKAYSFLIKPTIVLFVIYSVGISSIIRADVRYIDDLGRTYTGSNADWLTYQRYLEYFFSKLLNMGDYVVDFSPVSQLLACFFTAIAGAILMHVVTEKKKFSLFQYLAMVPLGLCPYYLECLSYKFEAPYYGMAVFFCIMPFLFFRSGNVRYYLVSIISLLGMFNTYYAVSGVYPMTVILLVLLFWIKGEDKKEILLFCGISATGYITALGIYKFLIMKPVDTWVSSELPSLDRLLPTIKENYSAYCSYVISDFKTIWLYLFALLVIGFLAVIPFRTRRNKAASMVVGVLAVISMALLCWGLYPALESTSFSCRAMIGYGALVALIAIFVCSDDNVNIFKIVSAILGWSYFLFALSYGNYLYAQKEYTDFRIQNVLNYLVDVKDYSEASADVHLEIMGSIGYSPVIENIPSGEGSIVKRLVPVTFCGGWHWGQMAFYSYYDLSGYSWDYENDGEVELADMGLPCIDHTMYFDVYGDKENLVIVLK